ncbi:MAG: hypothetical protein KDK10_00365 [Maritimibacter sp.]|nr:hypothetical protein [Maritimibacter sp.]
MLVTPLPMPTKLPSLLRGCVVPVLDLFNALPLKDVRRQSWRDRYGRVAPARVKVTRHKNGNIKSLDATLLDISKNRSYDFHKLTPSPTHFHCQIQIVGTVKDAARSILLPFLDYLVALEVEARYADGPRELISVGKDELATMAKELKNSQEFWLGSRPAAYAAQTLLGALVRREEQVRATEISAHMRVEALKRFSSANMKAARVIAEELEAARGFDAILGLNRTVMHSGMTDDQFVALEAREDQVSRLMRPLSPY